MKIITKKSSVISWVLGGIFIRLLIMPFSFHPDLLHIFYYPYHLAAQGVWDIYSFYKNTFETLGYSYYPPLTYYIFGFYLALIKPMLPGLDTLMEGYKKILLSGGGHISHLLLAGENDYIYRQIFMLKLPYLLADIILVVLLLKLVQGPMRKKMAVLWAINPVILYSTYLFGQFDILLAFFILLAFYLAYRGYIYSAAFCVGIATALKSYPAMLIPIFVLALGTRPLARLKLLAVAILPYLTLLIPLYFITKGEVLHIFYTYNLTHKFGLQNNFLSLLKLIFLSIGYLIILARVSSINREDKLIDGILLTLLLFYIFLFFNFHYFVWITPFILLKGIKKNTVLRYYAIMIIALIFFKIVNKSMWAGLFAPLNPEFFMAIPSFDSIINAIISFKIVRFAAHSVFAGTALLLFIKILTQTKTVKKTE